MSVDSSNSDTPLVDSVESLYKRHSAEILRYAIRCVGQRSVAEEITSEAFLRLHRHRDQVDSARAAAWLTTTVKNLARDHWRRVQVEQRHLAVVPRTQIAPDLPASWDDLISHPSLKAEHRVCLTLKYAHGMERKQIMDRTGMSDNQVKSCLQYGLKLLRDAFGGRE